MADADTGPGPVDEEGLLADIDRTRAELARTIDAISDRVSPAKNIERATEQLRQRADRTMAEVRQRADRTMEQAGQRASQIDPFVVGVAAATAAVAMAVTALFQWRRRNH